MRRERGASERAPTRSSPAASPWSAAWGRVYIGVAEIFSGLCMLAGEVELAARVRPTARRRSGLPDEEPVTPAPTPES